MRNSPTITALALALTAAPTGAWAYGVQLPEAGTVAFGRGGAHLARPTDPSVVMHNVANIVALRGFQLTIASNLSFFDHCFQRSGTYDTVDASDTIFTMSGDAPYSGMPYPQVCKNFSVGLAPMVLGTYQINRYIGIGFGVFAPSTQGRTQHFPDTVTLPGGLMAPSPARNLLYRKDLLVLHPVVAVSVQPVRWVRFGLGVAPSVGNFVFGLNANGVASSPQSPTSDVFIELNATGFFLAGLFGVQATPTPFLSFGAQFHYNFPIDASGTASAIGSVYARNPSNRVSSNFDILSMRVQLPWTLRASLRYNLPRPGRPTQDDGTGTYDPMTDDVFDVEAAFTYERTSNLSETSLTNQGSIRVDPLVTARAPASITIRSALTDVVGFRFGGDWNVIPGRLALRVGGSYETAGVSPELAQIHLPAYAGGSVHVGASYRWRWLTVHLGYGHFFFEDNNATNARRAVTVPAPVRDPMLYPDTPMGNAAWQANLMRQGLTPEGQIDPNRGCDPSISTRGEEACRINRGVYSASLNVVSVGLSARW
jgi:long-subunit fatty acid transport protein